MSIFNEANDLASQLVYGRYYQLNEPCPKPDRLVFVNGVTTSDPPIVKLIPNATVIEMKHCSHWPQMEDPETFNKLSLEFLQAR